MGNFSKGPWTVKYYRRSDKYFIYGKHPRTIAEIYGLPEHKENANLIAAAPDFYNETEKFQKIYNEHKDQDGNCKFTRSHLESLFSTLNKADGAK